MKRLHILRAGTHIDSAGRKHTFSATDIADVAESYDPALHEAPLVVGHPRDDKPAYGLIASLSAESDDLYAHPKQVHRDFAEMVRDGRFPKISASLYPPGAAPNPTPGRWHLRHVGFLGAQPPAIKGLRPVQFAAADDPSLAVDIEIDFAESSAVSPQVFGAMARLLRNFREWIIEEKDVETADRLVPDHEIRDIDAEADRRREKRNNQTNLSENEPQRSDPVEKPDDKEQTVDLSEREADLARREAQLAADRQAAARREAVEFVEGLAGKGIILPADTEHWVGLLTSLSGEPAAEFAEGEGAAPRSPADCLRDLLKRGRIQVNYDELTADRGGQPQAADFSAASGYERGNAERMEQHRKIEQYRKQHNIEYAEAAVRLGY